MHRDEASDHHHQHRRRAWPILAVALGAALTSAGLVPAATGSPPTDDEVRVIVQLAGEPAFSAVDGQVAADASARTQRDAIERQREDVQAAHNRLERAAEAAGLEMEPHRAFTDLVNAVAVSVPESELDHLSRLPGVEAVLPDQRFQVAADVSVPLIGAPEVWERTDADGVPAQGSGITVAVLDTGVDYTNPSLGGEFGPDHTVIGGYDFVNDDDDPMDDNGHGTHVAGIIAGSGDGDGGGVIGVAPEASITAYKVLDGSGGGWESDIIAALEEASDPGNPQRADVINLSLGGPGDGTDPLGLAATAAADAGVVVVAAAGNSGPGAQTVGSPAVADGVVAVGASASGLRLPKAEMSAPRTEPIQAFRAPFSASAPEEPVTGELVDVGDGREEDYERVGDVEGKVVAYRASLPRGLSFVQPHMLDQARVAEDHGAIAVLAYTENVGPFDVPEADEPGLEAQELNGGDGTVDVPLPGLRSGESFRMDRIVVLSLLDLQWTQLSRDLSEGPVEITISAEDVTDQVASFSSRGPTSQFQVKPELVAPGVEIRSAWPARQWEPGVYRSSGTSMAAPHVAGAAALLRQLDPDAAAERIGARLVGSAVPLDDAAVTTAGAGRLDVVAAADADLSASPTTVSLGLADLSAETVGGTDSVILHNDGETDIAVRLGARSAPGSVGTATVTPSEAVVPAGGELTVELEVSAPRPDADADLSGWIVVEAEESAASVRIPYQMSVRHLIVQTSPDPGDGRSEAFVWTPAALDEPPVVTVTPPRGREYEVTARHDHDQWYRAELDGKHVGAYQVRVEAVTAGGELLTGSAMFEVADGRGSAGAMHWQPVGPNAEGGPIATTPADSEVAVVNQYLKVGPWRTDDAGQNWTQQTRLPVAGGDGTTVVDAADPDTMWHAVNGSTGGYLNQVLDASYRGRILRTRDGGDSWQVLDFPDKHIIEFVSDAQTRTLVAITADAMVVSTDGGDVWTSYPNAVGGDLVGAAVSGEDLYLATNSAVWVVRDLLGGAPAAPEQVYDSGGEYSDRVSSLVADDVMVALLLGGDRVVGSRDGGSGWEDLYTLPSGGGMYMFVQDGDLAVSTYRPEIHLGRDHGASWSILPQPIAGAIENGFAHWPDGGLLWSAPGAGMFRTDSDGGEPTRIGVQGLTVYDMAVTEDESGAPVLLAGTDSDVFDTELPTRPKLAPDVAEWGLSGSEAHIGARVAQLATVDGEPRTVWKARKDALSNFWVYRSTDGGTEWELRGRTTEVPYDLVVPAIDPDRVVVPFWSVPGPGVYVTTDAGENWRKFFHDETFTTAAVDTADPDRLWLGGSSGLFRSDDFGQTVEKVLDGQVTAVAMEGSRIVAAGQEIRVSDDGGQTWVTADSGDVDMLVADVTVSPTDPDAWYAASGPFTANGLLKGGRGVLRSDDGGQTWTNVSLRLQNTDVVSVEVSPDGRWLLAGTVHGGVHRLRVR